MSPLESSHRAGLVAHALRRKVAEIAFVGLDAHTRAALKGDPRIAELDPRTHNALARALSETEDPGSRKEILAWVRSAGFRDRPAQARRALLRLLGGDLGKGAIQDLARLTGSAAFATHPESVQLAAAGALLACPKASSGRLVVGALIASSAFQALGEPDQLGLLAYARGPTSPSLTRSRALSIRWEPRRFEFLARLEDERSRSRDAALDAELLRDFLHAKETCVHLFSSEMGARHKGVVFGEPADGSCWSYGQVESRRACQPAQWAVLSPDPVVAAGWRDRAGALLVYSDEVFRVSRAQQMTLIGWIESKVLLDPPENGGDGRPKNRLEYVDPRGFVEAFRRTMALVACERPSSFGPGQSRLLRGGVAWNPNPPSTAERECSALLAAFLAA